MQSFAVIRNAPSSTFVTFSERVRASTRPSMEIAGLLKKKKRKIIRIDYTKFLNLRVNGFSRGVLEPLRYF